MHLDMFMVFVRPVLLYMNTRHVYIFYNRKIAYRT